MWFGNALWRQAYEMESAQQMLAGRLCFRREEEAGRQGKRGGREARKLGGRERSKDLNAEALRKTVERKDGAPFGRIIPLSSQDGEELAFPGGRRTDRNVCATDGAGCEVRGHRGLRSWTGGCERDLKIGS